MASDLAGLEPQSKALRQELKIWEKQFAAANGGRKAGRDDIKANAEIAAKYKEYNKLRDILSGKRPAETPSKSTKKREAATAHVETPSKRPKHPIAPPSKISKEENEVEHIDTPSTARKLFTPAHQRAFIGPTPQKDGQVLGLFDLLSAETPSRTQRKALHEVNINITCTPSKPNKTLDDDDLCLAGYGRPSRTPQSSGKRFLLDTIVTPMKRKLAEEGTPSSTMKHLRTPSFLRRDLQSMPPLFEDPQSPEARAPWKRKPFGRSLSGMIRDMKKQEEERLDEELELLREMEEEAEDGPSLDKRALPKVQVEDSQAKNVTLDEDGFVPSDVEEAEDGAADDGLDQNGRPRRVWKKKGLKRQTKRVIMRPVLHKPKAEIEQPGSDGEDTYEDVIAETQAQPAVDDVPDEAASDFDAAGDASENDDEDYGTAEPRTKKQEKSASKAAKRKEAKAAAESKASESAKDAKKKPRKVNPEKHANYRRLKIKNKKSKAGGRKFGRGRR